MPYELEAFIPHINNIERLFNGVKQRTRDGDFYDELIRCENLEEVRELLEGATESDLVKSRFSETLLLNFKNILNVACTDLNLPPEKFQLLYEHILNRFSQLDSYGEENWYYWEPIHFAVYLTYEERLGTIVKVYSENKDKLNVLTVFSENALHVLLEYGRRTESFHVQLSNGWESRLCHVIAEEKAEVVRCAKILIDAGVDINHNNIWNETPLLIAIRYRLLNVIELLLRTGTADLDTCKDPYTKKSARDMLREHEIHLDLLLPNTVTVSSANMLFTFLKGREEEEFLRYNNEHVQPWVKNTEGIPGTSTMLQLCLIKGYIDFEKTAKPPEETPDEGDILKTAMLQFFCRMGFGRSVEHLLNNGADVNYKSNVLGKRDVFQMAVKLSYYPFLTILLEHRSGQVKERQLLDVLERTDENLFRGANRNVRHTLFLLTSKLEMFYQSSRPVEIDLKSRKVLNRILDLYLEYNTDDEYKENICQVLRLGASLCNERLEKVSYDTLKAHLDECVGPTNKVCYDSIISDDNDVYSETAALHYLAHDSKKRDLLNHPALIYLIHAKWERTCKFFYMDFVLYLLFFLVLCVYMVQLQVNCVNTSVKAFLIVLLLMVSIKELVQLLFYFPRYCCEVTNWLEIGTIVCCLFNLFTRVEELMVGAILLSTMMLLLLLGQFPKFTKYMIIFSSTKYFLEYVSFYFIQFVSFALCFFILLPPPESDDTPGVWNTFGQITLNLFNTLIFFIGQYDGDITEVPKFPVFGRIIVAMFIFCMTIILNNLLVGLIVTDMDFIQKTSKEQRQVSSIRYITRIETFHRQSDKVFFGKWLRKCFGNTKVFCSGERKIVDDIMTDASVFDDIDKAYLKEIHDNRLQKKNVLVNLYEYIVAEVYNDHNKGLRENRDILIKLSRLEEQLRKRRPR
ncbi:transient receptor potential channel pyrexia-like isoform X1 [Anthonomus grandis grandis]|uniref:transient receptor potential channel pyrexia-like isoform X1 n=1 Tax=Anthonomus grandis grandis TaxID=2921223 RepID=UPI002165BB7B|nr:transient receptor potential channel pyrexia-like isoform X1 [Anthonomus grandis grandis]XP_050294857.1 transient receptor potential channel pyrexia-like isoform X1 [Anthonomus grandis grandis]XP_050294858.1 transient receptor potential channel pyrexia-like isoform X1 [Anthonomus grandis grandis]